jgi:protein-S-isoprenylcysteine O-methyltransferase Ste14
MNNNSPGNQPNEGLDMKAAIRRRILQAVVQMLILIAILFISSGRLDWIWIWVYIGVGIVIMAVNSLVMSPELIAERGRFGEVETRQWDKVITTIIIVPTLALPLVAGLDERFGWSPDLDIATHVTGVILMVLGQGLFTWGMAVNKFFSTSVRIQMERDHTVVSSGPYQYIRHPGYVGMIVSWFATSLLFGSLWSLIPTGIAACLLVVRTSLEDKTLIEDLDGYKEYATRVRYRLLPGVW